MYAAWKGIVHSAGEVARINLLLNRASPWLDVDSYLPHEGKVVIRNKTARSIEIRMPRWVDLKRVECRVGGAESAELQPSRVAGRYLAFEGLSSGDELTLTFPVEDRVEKYTLLWKAEDMWPESTDPGKNWQPPNPKNVYKMTFRGNTLVDIQPRMEGNVYQLFVRDAMRSATASMKSSKRFIPDRLASW